MPAGTDILILVAHPAMEQSRLNRQLMRAAAAARWPADAPDGRAGSPRTAVRDLYALYPDYLIDVAAEQAALAAARLVVWQHPVHWYGMPPLMKLWLDSVLGFGWAYGPGGRALQGKDLWLVVSTGGGADAYHPGGYNRYFFDAFLPPYEQSAVLCGMRFLPPLVIHGAHRVDEAGLAEQAALYAERLTRYPAWPELDNLDACPTCAVPLDARPADADARPTAQPLAGVR
jgi:glutathione-regulated potassium-efflux system ancillary protein KefF